MQVIQGLDVAALDNPCVVTVGKFSVVHLGHRELLSRVVAAARELDASSAVVTFDRDPLELLAPERAPGCRLATLEQRMQMLQECGIDVVLLLEFTRAVAELEPEEFVGRAIAGILRARRVVVGRDHRFGRRHRGDVALLRELGTQHGFDVEAIDLIELAEHKVSSSEVRILVSQGMVEEAARLLGRPYRLGGRVVEGKGRGGSQLGFPTANIQPHAKVCLPAEGVYAGWWIWKNERYPGVIDVGRSPVFGDVEDAKVEIHIFDFDRDIYGEHGEVEFTAWLRPDQDFGGSVEALIEQIGRDAEQARRLLGA